MEKTMIFKEEVCWMSSSSYLLEDIVKIKQHWYMTLKCQKDTVL